MNRYNVCCFEAERIGTMCVVLKLRSGENDAAISLMC